jgi:hypothetical protein
MRRAIALTMAMLLTSACDAQGGGAAASRPAVAAESRRTDMGDSDKARAIAAGRDYVKQKFPDFSEDRKTPVVTDAGDDWQFTYELPIDMLGGAPVVLLSKADLSVTKAYRTQ